MLFDIVPTQMTLPHFSATNGNRARTNTNLWFSVGQTLVCGFFMQVAHKEGEKGNYLTVKDNQVRFQFRNQS